MLAEIEYLVFPPSNEVTVSQNDSRRHDQRSGVASVANSILMLITVRGLFLGGEKRCYSFLGGVFSLIANQMLAVNTSASRQ